MSAYTVTTRPLAAAIPLCHIGTSRFKTARLTFLSVRPADAAESPLATLYYGILRRGSEEYPRLALLNRRLDELYGSTLTIRNYIHGDEHIISFTAEMLADDYRLPGDTETDILDGVMELLSDMLLHPLRDENGLLRTEAVEAEKQSLADSLRSISNDTRTFAADRFRRLMCEGEPYGISIGGTPEEVAQITPAAVTAHGEHHMSAACCAVFYAGAASVDTVVALWNRHFSAWHPIAAPRTETCPHPIPVMPKRGEDSRPVAQGKLCIGWSCGERCAGSELGRVAAWMVCNELFGVMPTSLLFRHVRETLGLCYYCESALDLSKGILWVSSGIRSDTRDEAESAIRETFARLQAGDFEPADVETAKLTLLDSYRQIEDSQGAMESFIIRQMLDGTDHTPEAYMQAIAAITPADVVAEARRFCPDTTYFLRGTASAAAGEEDFDVDE